MIYCVFWLVVLCLIISRGCFYGECCRGEMWLVGVWGGGIWSVCGCVCVGVCCCFFLSEDGRRGLGRCRGVGEVFRGRVYVCVCVCVCLLVYTSEAAYELLCVYFGGRRIIKKNMYLYAFSLPSVYLTATPTYLIYIFQL